VSTVILLYEIQKKIEQFLESFLVKTGAQHVFLAAKSGEVLVYSGSKEEKQISSITALLAGVFNATEELAKLVNEHQFKQFFIKGEVYNLFYQNVSSQFLLIVMFEEETLLGSVRVLSQKLADQLRKGLKENKRSGDSLSEKINGELLMEDLFEK